MDWNFSMRCYGRRRQHSGYLISCFSLFASHPSHVEFMMDEALNKMAIKDLQGIAITQEVILRIIWEVIIEYFNNDSTRWN